MDNVDHTNKIYCGKSAFNKMVLITSSAQIPVCELFHLNGVDFIKCEHLEDNKILTFDPKLVKLLREYEDSKDVTK